MRAAADHIKPLVLELGGKSPSLILGDADLGLATREVIKGIYANTGQFCNASSRVIVDARVKDAVIEQLVTLTEQLRVGPGIDNPDMVRYLRGPTGPRSRLHPGRHRTGRTVPHRRRAAPSARPRLLRRPHRVRPVHPQSRIAQEEIFGPVLAVLTVEDDDQALQVANSVQYGLAAGVFTNDLNRAIRLAKNLKAGRLHQRILCRRRRNPVRRLQAKRLRPRERPRRPRALHPDQERRRTPALKRHPSARRDNAHPWDQPRRSCSGSPRSPCLHVSCRKNSIGHQARSYMKPGHRAAVRRLG